MAGARMRVPSLIDLRKGHPKARNLPHAKMAWAARRAAARLDASDESTFALCYSAGSSGNPLFVQRLARFLSDSYGTPCFADNLFTTNGVSHGIELACAALTAPGDAVWVEGATYFLAHQIFVDHRLKVTALPTDAHGLDTDALASFLASGELGAPPAMVYLVPTHGNPSGATLPLERR
jgi:DNA-binding transcriptional MocR family regulator